MRAFEVMTRTVVSVSPETSTREVARTLVEHGISAVPVVDATGTPVGMVSEGDLMADIETHGGAERRDWWLTLLAEGETLSPTFLETLGKTERPVRTVMRSPVITVDEHADLAEVATLLHGHNIKRVPVLRDGKVVGIVSRADIVRAFAALAETQKGPKPGLLGSLIDTIRQVDSGYAAPEAASPGIVVLGRTAEAEPTESVSADAFRKIVGSHASEDRKAREGRSAELRTEKMAAVADLTSHHVTDQQWQTLLHHAREAAERGETEFLLMRFPSELLTDGGRAINVPDPEWPSTLRGEPAEIYRRYETELKPHGFTLSGQILEFPGGFPGDAGLFLVWGKNQ